MAGGVLAPPRCARSIPRTPFSWLLPLLLVKRIRVPWRMLQSLAPQRTGKTRSPAQGWRALLRAECALLRQD